MPVRRAFPVGGPGALGVSATPDPITRALIALIALGLLWIAFRDYLPSQPVNAAPRETVNVNLERIGGHFILQGVIPIRCADLKP